MPSWDDQKLCIGSTFLLVATNGYNPSRRINFQGFCQSVDYLFEAVEDTVLTRGGEILHEQRELKRWGGMGGTVTWCYGDLHTGLHDSCGIYRCPMCMSSCIHPHAYMQVRLCACMAADDVLACTLIMVVRAMSLLPAPCSRVVC